MIKDSIALSENGLCRGSNQDAVLALHTQKCGIFAVADGMGGHFRGELASRMAVDSLNKWWNEIGECIEVLPFLEIVAELEKKIYEIHHEIYQMYQNMEQLGGTTLCVLLFHHDSYAVLNIGDSRLYRCKGKQCIRMTTDDVQEEQSEYRLTQALGAQKDLKIAFFTGKIEKKMCFVLCTDGIYKYCRETRLMRQMRLARWRKSVAGIEKRIKKDVYKNGAEDNLSLVIVLADREK